MIKNLIKGMYRGFAGGPDFSHERTLRFTLEDRLLSVTVPYTNVAFDELEQPTHFPYRSPHWIDETSRAEEQHHISIISTDLWMYVPVVPLGTCSEYGMLTFQPRIAKLADDVGFSAFNQSALKEYLIDDYEKFHNGPVDEKTGAGTNTKILQQLQEQSQGLNSPYSDEEFIEILEIIMSQNGYPSIPPAKIVTINNVDWVFYQEVKGISLTRSDYYCLALDDNHYLECLFKHRVDRSNKHKKWRDGALAAQKKIMEGVILTDLKDNIITIE